MHILPIRRACLLMLLLTTAECDAKGIDRPVTCDAGIYAPGQLAFINCNLRHGILAPKIDVTLVRFALNATKDDLGKDIMTCRWRDRERKHKCDIREQGYILGDATDMEHPTVMISSVSDKFAGLYMCSVEPSDGTQPQGCQLTVRDGWIGHTRKLRQTTNSKCADGNKHMWIIVIPIMIAVVFALLLIIFGLKYRRLRKRSTTDHNHEEKQHLIVNYHPNDDTLRREIPNDKVKSEVNTFVLGEDQYQTLMRHLKQEMCSKSGEAKVQMIETHLPVLPTGKETGDILVVDFGSTSLKVVLVKLHDSTADITGENYTFSPDIKLGTGTQMFDFIADCVGNFAIAQDLHGETMPLALVFSFPCKQGSDLSKATLTKWTKGFDCKGVKDKELGELLEEALTRKQLTLKFKIKVIVNDAVGTLVSVACRDPTCKIALILGNGFNACFLKEKMVVNTEWGSVGYDGCLNMLTTPIDSDLDRLSVNPKEQILEKMVSRMYIGEIVRKVLLYLTESGLLFKSNNIALAVLKKKDVFQADYVSLIESDTNQHYLNTKIVLRLLNVENYKEEDWKTVHYVCQVVSERASYLAAAALATLINHIGQPDGGDITVAVDGSLYQYHPRFHGLVQSKTRELLNDELKEKLKLVSSENGSVIGAARMAATLR